MIYNPGTCTLNTSASRRLRRGELITFTCPYSGQGYHGAVRAVSLWGSLRYTVSFAFAPGHYTAIQITEDDIITSLAPGIRPVMAITSNWSNIPSGSVAAGKPETTHAPAYQVQPISNQNSPAMSGR
ncbi:MAG: hypothetical protein ACPG7F_04850 [Aggregatilineales bacterium]